MSMVPINVFQTRDLHKHVNMEYEQKRAKVKAEDARLMPANQCRKFADPTCSPQAQRKLQTHTSTIDKWMTPAACGTPTFTSKVFAMFSRSTSVPDTSNMACGTKDVPGVNW